MTETVQNGPVNKSSRFLKTKWTTTSGLVAGTTEQKGRKLRLKYSKTVVSNKKKVLL